MKLENIGQYLVVLMMCGIFFLGLSTLFINPLVLFLLIVVGSGLVALGVMGTAYLMLKDIKIFFKDVDSDSQK